MNQFEKTISQKIKSSLKNNFGKENFDEFRFGKYIAPKQAEPKPKLGVVRELKNFYWKTRYPRPDRTYDIITDYGDKLNFLFSKLNNAGKELLVELIAYRILGPTKVKLSINNNIYWAALEKAKELKSSDEAIDPNFMHFILEKFNLEPIGYNIEFFFSEVAIAIDFIIEQYAYKENDKKIVGIEKDDVVLDIGGCWGDTALYFADKVGENGKVYSFEFIPNNIKIHNVNTDLNPELKKRIEVVPFPVSNVSNEEIFYLDNGPGSKICDEDFEGRTGTSTTLSIDDFVAQNNIKQVDFIKMDIEGAEPFALQGAINTIKKHKPKLAIAIYHSMEDFVNIPKWILDLDCGYELFLGHYTIHAEETVIFAKVK